jgi:RNA polymerase sigma-70 factor, ECF subfamily
MSTHASPQFVSSTLHDAAQRPRLQTGSPFPHDTPHAPQCRGSDRRTVQTSPQAVSPMRVQEAPFASAPESPPPASPVTNSSGTRPHASAAMVAPIHVTARNERKERTKHRYHRVGGSVRRRAPDVPNEASEWARTPRDPEGTCLVRGRRRYLFSVDSAASKRPHLRLVDPPAPSPRGERGEREPALDDAQLIAAVREGDEDAARALYARLHAKVDGTVRRLLGPADSDREDCVQLAFVEIVRSIDRYRGECSLEHWATRVAAHVVFKHIRRRKTERRIFERGARTSDRPEPISAPRRLIARDLAARVREKLATLSTDKVYAFLLHDVLGFDLREIAEITSVSVAAAQQRLVRGRREVHAHLAADAELAAMLEDLEEES